MAEMRSVSVSDPRPTAMAYQHSVAERDGAPVDATSPAIRAGTEVSVGALLHAAA